jgi:hypothetical protein
MKYWVYMKDEVPGAYDPGQLAAMPGFGMTTLVCPAEGEIQEKNWRRAGEFADLAAAVTARQSSAPPAAPLTPPVASEVDALLDNASTRLFSHVADLMKELETRRDEKSLIVSLQRQISALKEELGKSRERSTMLEIKLPRLAELEESLKKAHGLIEQLQGQLAARDAAAAEARVTAEKLRNESDAAKRRVSELNNDLAIRNKLVDKLSKDLSDKELSLAKSLGVIRRLEEDLNRLCPSPDLLRPASAPRAAEAAVEPVRAVEPPAPLPVAEAPVELAPLPEARTPVPPPTQGTFTTDEPPVAPPYLEPTPESPKAQEALLKLLKKVFPGQPH